MDTTDSTAVPQDKPTPHVAFDEVDPGRYDLVIEAALVEVTTHGHVLAVVARVVEPGPSHGLLTRNTYPLAQSDDFARRRMKMLVTATGLLPDDQGGFQVVALVGTSLSAEIQADGTWCCEATVQVTPSDGSPGAPKPTADPYDAKNGFISLKRTDRVGQLKFDTLASFDSRIMEEIIFDDGVVMERHYRIEALYGDGTRSPSFTIPAADFLRMDWVAQHLGARAVVSAGAKRRDELREAIQQLSLPTQRTVYRHTGWKQINGRWAYLHAGGSFGGHDVSVQLDSPLDRVRFPDVVVDLKTAVGWSARILDCGPATVMIILLAVIYLAPLSSIVEPDFLVWLLGQSGALKSELAALGQAHYGMFSRKALPASWISTENSIEAILFMAKDALVVIDDFAPQGDPASQRELQRVAGRVVRAIGNRASRGRLRSDLTRSPDRPPRGLALSTGEQLPLGASIEARTVPVEVERALLDLKVISEIQEHANRLPHAMAGYISWLAPQLDALRVELPHRKIELRNEFQLAGHARQPEALAQLAIGMELFLKYAVAVGAMAEPIAATWWKTTLTALRETGTREARQQKANDPARRFLDVIRTLRAQGRIVLIDKNAAVTEASGSDFNGDLNRTPIGAWFVGWRDADTAYLIPQATRRSVIEFLRESGESWPHTQRALNAALLRGGFLIVAAPKAGKSAEPEHQVRIGDKKRRVLHILLKFLDEDLEEEPDA